MQFLLVGPLTHLQSDRGPKIQVGDAVHEPTEAIEPEAQRTVQSQLTIYLKLPAWFMQQHSFAESVG